MCKRHETKISGPVPKTEHTRCNFFTMIVTVSVMQLIVHGGYPFLCVWVHYIAC